MEAINTLLLGVERAIKKGEFEEAAKLGNTCSSPLCVPSETLSQDTVLQDGPQGLVSQGRWQDRKVAIKRAKITSSADMDRLKSQVFCWALQLAEALAFVHSHGIVHRDVKPGNLLIDDADNLHLSDFGISVLEEELRTETAEGHSSIGRQKPSGGFHKRHMVGTLEYLAPEVLLKQPYGTPIDIFAWAVTVNELATSTVPYSDCTKDNPAAHTVLNFGYGRQELAAAIVSEGLRPLMRPDTPEELAELLEACWHIDAKQRPTAENLALSLQRLLPKISMESWGRSRAPTPANILEQRRHKAALNREAENNSTRNETREPDNHVTATTTSDSLMSTKSLRPGNLDEVPAWAGHGQQATVDKVAAGVFATAGSRGEDRMEDRHVLASPVQPGNPHMHCFAIFDGHRGKPAAQFAADNLLRFLSDHWASDTAGQALQNTFLHLDQGFREEQNAQIGSGGSAGNSQWPGCTAIAVLVCPTQLFVANAGDCKAILCRSGDAIDLNREHNADNAEERARIERCGGLFKLVNGAWRLGEAGIQVTRSIGDGDLKSSGLTACPEVDTYELSSQDTFLIIASDGLWEKLSSQDAVDLVHDTVKDPAMCAQRLTTEALTRGSGDNITVIVAFLQPVQTLEAIFHDGKHSHKPARTFYGGR